MSDRIVLCLDGTWNSTFQSVERDDGTKVLKPSNPLKTARAVLPVDSQGNRQITYYDSGVGALGLYPGVSNRILNFADSKLGGAWGAGFEANVEQAATFLVNNVIPTTDVYVFGYSRGAAQARALTRFIDWLGGITPKNDAYYMPLFFRHYVLTREAGSPADVISEGSGDQPFNRLQPFSIKFLGVWDTVMALGSRFRAKDNNSIKTRSFHVGDQPALCVEHARQALAIDERRYDFRPEIWSGPSDGQTIEQRWFPGVHGNVGGGCANDGLANAALQWIVGDAKKQGLQTDDNFLKRYRPFSRDEIGDSYKGVYPILDNLRFKRKKGVRTLTLAPATANLSIDRSAIERLCADPKKYTEMDKPYRAEGVVKYVKKYEDKPNQLFQKYGINSDAFSFPDNI